MRKVAFAALLLGPVSAMGASSFDGEYTGSTALERGFGATCGPTTTANSKVVVQDNQFTYDYPAFSIKVTARISPDGSVAGFQPLGGSSFAKVSGHVAEGTLNVVLETSACSRRYLLQKAR